MPNGHIHVNYPTIPLADLLLEKLQIVKIADKNVKDVMILLRENDVGNDKINVEYLSDVLSENWGFYYTVRLNLEKIKKHLYYLPSEKDATDVELKINKIIDAIIKKPKSLRWRLCSIVGPLIKWYNEV